LEHQQPPLEICRKIVDIRKHIPDYMAYKKLTPKYVVIVMRRLRGRKFTVREAPLLREAIRALWGFGVMHNDLHLGNIMIVKEKRKKVAKIIDFGNAITYERLLAEHSYTAYHKLLVDLACPKRTLDQEKQAMETFRKIMNPLVALESRKNRIIGFYSNANMYLRASGWDDNSRTADDDDYAHADEKEIRNSVDKRLRSLAKGKSQKNIWA
jgi:serine/threonine protein kinase